MSFSLGRAGPGADAWKVFGELPILVEVGHSTTSLRNLQHDTVIVRASAQNRRVMIKNIIAAAISLVLVAGTAVCRPLPLRAGTRRASS